MKAWTLGWAIVTLFSTVAWGANSNVRVGLARETLEQLDAASNLLLTIADSDKQGYCGIEPTEARRMLLAIRPILEDKRKAAVAAFSNRISGKPIANPRWDQTCLRKCHCGLYASILEGVGEQRLVASDRAMLDRMSGKARMMSREHLEVCARTSPWFCQSDLLVRLRKEARRYPDPAAPPANPAASASPAVPGASISKNKKTFIH
jgi:hypothetical protein